MKIVSKLLYFIVCFVLFIEITIYFLPKRELWYLAQKELSKNLITVNSSKFQESGFYIDIKDSTINYDKLDIATVKDCKIESYLFYNEIVLKGIRFADIASNISPRNIKSLKIKWSVFDGNKIKIIGDGEMGHIDGYVDILKQKATIYLKASKLMKRRYRKTLRGLKKEKRGYKYVQSFK